MTDRPGAPNDASDLRTALAGLLCFDAYALNLAFGRIYKPLLDPLGLTYPQYLVMLILWSEGALGIGRIGDRLGLDSSTLTPLVKRLEAAGLVRRDRDPGDERRVIVSATDRGLALRAQTGHLGACVQEATGLDCDEVRALQDSLTRLRHALADGAARIGKAGGGRTGGGGTA